MNPLSQLFMDPDFLDQLLAGRVVPPQQPIENDRLADVFGRNVAVNRNRNRPTAKPPPFTTGFEHPNQQQFNRGPLGVIEQDPAAFAKGVAIAPFTAAPDILGMGINGVNALNSMLQKKTGIPIAQFGTISGDPLRELIGLDPKSGQGMAGEIVSPVGTMAKALGVSAKAVAAGAKLAAGTNFDPSLAMTLFHGTPHKFNKFSLDAIGTGEGAQAYGHGLYFAENPGVAGSYQKALSGTVNDLDDTLAKNFEFKGKTFSTDMPHSEVVKLPVDERAAYAMMGEGGQPSAARALAEIDEYGDDLGVKQHLEELLANPARIEFPKPSQGHLYEVDIPDEITNRMLDWDAPLSELTNEQKLALDPWIKIADEERGGMEFGPRGTIGEVLNTINKAGMDVDLTEDLASKGIPGIRFYDGNSRISGTPFKQVKKSFLSELPEDAEFEDVLDLVGTGQFSKEQDAVIKALEADDWLGFDYPSQAINAAYTDASRYDPSDTLLKALDESAGGSNRTRNIVVFNPDDIRQVKRDGEVVFENKLGIGN